MLCTSLGEDQGSSRKVESRQALAASQLCSTRSPVQPARNHQVQHQPEIAFHSDRDSLADAPEFLHKPSFDISNRGLCGAKQKGAGQSYVLEPLPEDAPFKCADVSGNIGEFWHDL
jgi:hypothetical protein